MKSSASISGAATGMVPRLLTALISGKLLALMMDQFLKYNTGEWDQEILQCMYCLYGISVSVSTVLRY